MSETLSLEDLSRSTGFSPRAIRFYIQRKLVPPPRGVGRGNHYDAEHLSRLKRIAELQSSGHSLVAIGKILEGANVAEVPVARAHARPRAAVAAQLWTRVPVADGIELHFEAQKHPDVAQLLAIRDAVERMMNESEEGE